MKSVNVFLTEGIGDTIIQVGLPTSCLMPFDSITSNTKKTELGIKWNQFISLLVSCGMNRKLKPNILDSFRKSEKMLQRPWVMWSYSRNQKLSLWV